LKKLKKNYFYGFGLFTGNLTHHEMDSDSLNESSDDSSEDTTDDSDKENLEYSDSDDEESIEMDSSPESPESVKTPKNPEKSESVKIPKSLENSESVTPQETLGTSKTTKITCQQPSETCERTEIIFPKTPEITKVTKMVYPGAAGTSETVVYNPESPGKRPVNPYNPVPGPSKRSRKHNLKHKKEKVSESSEEFDSESKRFKEEPMDDDDNLYFDEPEQNMTTGDLLNVSMVPKDFNKEIINYRECVRKTVDGNWQCLLCFRQAKKTNNIIDHVKTHNYRCQNCGKCFSGRQASKCLKQHIESCLRKRKGPPICDYCGKKFDWMSRMKIHMTTCKQRPKY
jgi:hypothetical protein